MINIYINLIENLEFGWDNYFLNYILPLKEKYPEEFPFVLITFANHPQWVRNNYYKIINILNNENIRPDVWIVKIGGFGRGILTSVIARKGCGGAEVHNNQNRRFWRTVCKSLTINAFNHFSLITFHSSLLKHICFGCAKHGLLPPKRRSFAPWKTVFGEAKAYLSQTKGEWKGVKALVFCPTDRFSQSLNAYFRFNNCSDETYMFHRCN